MNRFAIAIAAGVMVSAFTVGVVSTPASASPTHAAIRVKSYSDALCRGWSQAPWLLGGSIPGGYSLCRSGALPPYDQWLSSLLGGGKGVGMSLNV